MRSQVFRPLEDGTNRFHSLDQGSFVTLEDHTTITNSLQAKIDALMMEYCPEDMTDDQLDDQLDEWEKHQVIAKP